MIRINRDSAQPLHEQLSEQIRYLIATGQYTTGDRLPSTRKLGKELGLSFHTVRKAYDALVEAGVVTSKVGSGYCVARIPDTSKSARLEAGAATVQAALRQLIASGLSEDEIEYVFDEQRSLVTAELQRPSAVFVAEFVEMAETCTEKLSMHLPVDLEAATLAELPQHADAEIAICPFPLVRRVLEQLPRADVLGLHVLPRPAAAAAAARLFDYETLLMVVRYSDAIGPLTRMLRSATGFSGQLIATAVDEGTTGLEALTRQSDAMLYLPGTARRVRSLFPSAAIHELLDFEIPGSEPDRIRTQLPL